jgi:hypothetical protein
MRKRGEIDFVSFASGKKNIKLNWIKEKIT